MAERNDPYAQYNFLIEIDDLSVAGFTEVGGLTTESDAVDYREGSDDNTIRKLPGLRKYTNITLKRGYTKNDELWQWRKTTIDGNTLRKSGAIVLLNEQRKEVMRWNFKEGWLAKWEGPSLNATTNEAAIESIEIIHEGLELGG
ncbi:phage tail protein [Pleionea sp. CnH1-48]|uniref:phage tail protein n=1 Tax=Pleionea sp. CnH1-48 TaxID=2954494 RepID=UPI002097FB2E|nr:phage tail protein [Pleionea sp. CnH1-48]MCO7223332.1 phage tail protein [Pleionea sp. CnH1-48]